jgi:uncharacterized protein
MVNGEGGMERVNSAFTLFLSLMVEAIPFLLLGVFFSGVLTFFISERQLLRWIPKNPFLGSLFGSCVGFLFPVCECGNVPVARRLLVQGAPPSVAIGFLLAAPTINPIVFWATWTAFRDQPEIVFLRIGLSLMIATLMGWIFSFQKDLTPFLRHSVAATLNARNARSPQGTSTMSILDTSKPVNRLISQPVNQTLSQSLSQPVNPLLQSGTFFLGQSSQALPTDDPVAMQAVVMDLVKQPIVLKLKLLIEGMVQELRELSGVLILGSLLAAVIQSFVPREVVLSLGQDPITSIIAMMLLAAIISVCSTVDSFFALSFASTFTTGALVSFLVFGPMIDLKAFGLLLTIFKPRAIFYLFSISALLTFLSALILNLFS